MSASRSEGAPAGRPSRFVVRQFSGPVIYRTVRAHHARTMWQSSLSRTDYRWNPTFPAVYTSLALEVSLVERMKRTAERTTALVLGIGHVVLHRVVDLTNPTMLRQVGVSVQDLLTDDLSEPHRVATAAYFTGVVGLLVPAGGNRSGTGAIPPDALGARDPQVRLRDAAP